MANSRINTSLTAGLRNVRDLDPLMWSETVNEPALLSARLNFFNLIENNLNVTFGLLLVRSSLAK